MFEMKISEKKKKAKRMNKCTDVLGWNVTQPTSSNNVLLTFCDHNVSAECMK